MLKRDMLRVAKAPCKSCPYRRDVPSGVWAPEEYAKLPPYDGSMGDQIMGGGIALFDCHQQDGKLCAGWLGCHGPYNLVALRLTSCPIGPDIMTYESPIPLWGSGAAAKAHGTKRPGKDAHRMMDRLVRKFQRKKET